MSKRIWKELRMGKSIGRALQNEAILDHAKGLTGKVLDLGGGSGSYYRYLPDGLDIIKTNVQGDGLDKLVDINEKLPYADGSFNAVLLFNVLYIAEDPVFTLKEIRRVLASGGTLLMTTPFMATEMREPHDYWRFTSEGLEKILRAAGFTDLTLVPIGERFTVVAMLENGFGIRFFYAVASMMALWMDKRIPEKLRKAHPAPIGYLTVAK